MNTSSQHPIANTHFKRDKAAQLIHDSTELFAEKKAIESYYLIPKMLQASAKILQLGDEEISQWLAINEPIAFSRHNINLLFIQTILLPPINWTDSYKTALQKTLDFLKHTPSFHYSKPFLSRLRITLNLMNSQHFNHKEKEDLSQQIFNLDIFTSIGSHTTDYLLSLLENNYKDRIFPLIVPELPKLIQSVHSLCRLLESEWLSNDQRTAILHTFKEKLTTFIINKEVLRELLNIPLLLESQQTFILDTVFNCHLEKLKDNQALSPEHQALCIDQKTYLLHLFLKNADLIDLENALNPQHKLCDLFSTPRSPLTFFWQHNTKSKKAIATELELRTRNAQSHHFVRPTGLDHDL